jgi:hypothetical protein
LTEHRNDGNHMILLRELLGDYDVAFKGAATAGAPLITVVDNFRVFKGHSVRGSPLYTIVGNKLFKGMAVSGRPLATISGNMMFLGTQVAGAPAAIFKDRLSVKGVSGLGPALVTVPSKNRKTLFAATYHILFG